MPLITGGKGRTSGIVGVRLVGDRTARIYSRSGQTVSASDRELHPWFVATSGLVFPTLSSPPDAFPLNGQSPLNARYVFRTWGDLWNAIHFLVEQERNKRGSRVNSYTDLPSLYVLPDPAGQWLVFESEHMFRSLAPENVVVAAMEVETASGPPDMRNADSTEGAVTVISLSRSNGETTTIRSKKKDEKGLVRDALRWFDEVDPDILTGFHLQEGTLPYMLRRCERLGIDPLLGRESSPARSHTSQALRAAVELPGRSPVDLSDILGSREFLELFLGDTHPTRKQKLVLDTLHRVRSFGVTGSASERVRLASECADALFGTLFPLFQSHSLLPELVARSSSAFRTETALAALLVSENVSMPASVHSSSIPDVDGASYAYGHFSPVLECFIHPVAPVVLSRIPRNPSEETGRWIHGEWPGSISRSLLSGEDTTLEEPRAYILDMLSGFLAMQKQRIVRFSAGVAPELLTGEESLVLEEVGNAFHLHNARLFQTDENIVFIEPPDNAVTPVTLGNFLRGAAAAMPAGLRLSIVHSYDGAVSLGHGLFGLSASGRMERHPSARIPRFFEPFLRTFFVSAMGCVLRKDWTALHGLYQSTRRLLSAHAIHVRELAKQETLSESVEDYEKQLREGRRHPSAVFEAIKRRVPDAKAGRIVHYYITGTKRDVLQAEHCRLADEWDPASPDENTEYYLDRLDQCAERFRIIFEPASFERIFSPEDLFGFDPTGVQTVSGETGREDSSISPRRPTIDFDPSART